MDSGVYRERRRRFLDSLPPRSLALLPAAPMAVRTNDVDYPYRPDSDLVYLTGFPEPGSYALFDNAGEPSFTMFVLPRDRERETWTGKRFGVEGAKDVFGADEAFTAERLDEIFAKRLDQREHLYFAIGRDEALNQKVLEQVRRSQAVRARTGAPPLTLASPGDVIHEMRLRKSDAEVAVMREAARITAVAHREAHAAARPGVHEYEVEAAIDYAFRRHGAAGPAYPSIVASGANATVLHYTENSRRMDDGDLLLIDAGCEYRFYASDVTRTFPVGRKFTPEQRAVYEVVLAAQKSTIEAVGDGATVEGLHAHALRVLVEGLCELGVLRGSVDEAIEKETYRPFYMHRTGHYLGIDVHDVGRYRDGDRPRVLEPGMAFTVEPGLYFGGSDSPERFAGIGIRIEDDVLVTAEGCEVLTREIPKEVEAIEALRAEALDADGQSRR